MQVQRKHNEDSFYIDRLPMAAVKKICLYSSEEDQRDLFSVTRACKDLSLKFDLDIFYFIFKNFPRFEEYRYLTTRLSEINTGIQVLSRTYDMTWSISSQSNNEEDSFQSWHSSETEIQSSSRVVPSAEESLERALWEKQWDLLLEMRNLYTERLNELKKHTKLIDISDTDILLSNRVKTIEITHDPLNPFNRVKQLKRIRKIRDCGMLLKIDHLILNLSNLNCRGEFKIYLMWFSKELKKDKFTNTLQQFKSLRIDYPIFKEFVNDGIYLIKICSRMQYLKSLTLRPIWAHGNQVEIVKKINAFVEKQKIALHYDLGSPYDPLNIAQNENYLSQIFINTSIEPSTSYPDTLTYPLIASLADKEFQHYLLVKGITDKKLTSAENMKTFCDDNYIQNVDYVYQNKFGFSLLTAASFHAQPDLVHWIIQKNPAATHKLDPYGKSAIEWAINRCTKPGLNPEAIHHERIIGLQIILELIAAGADVNMQNSRGETALDVCSYARNEDAAQLLKQNGGKHNAPPKEAPPKKLLFVVDKDKLL
jgi:hypothetical protein